MFNSAFDDLGAKGGDYYPKELRAEIDEVNSRIYAHLNNGVYEAGFAGSQAAHDAAVDRVFDTLEWLEKRLSRQRFLLGDDRSRHPPFHHADPLLTQCITDISNAIVSRSSPIHRSGRIPGSCTNIRTFSRQ
jgi:hypothetical protein